MKHYIGATRNGMSVYVELVLSAAAPQIAQQPHLLYLAKNLLAASDVSGKHLWLEGDMGRNIGVCDIIEIGPKDDVFYAQRVRSELFEPFVKKGELEPTSFLSLELSKVDSHGYQLIQLVFGHPLPTMPSERNKSKTDRAYWSKHARLLGDWPINNRSVTKECPW